MKFPASAGLQV